MSKIPTPSTSEPRTTDPTRVFFLKLWNKIINSTTSWKNTTNSTYFRPILDGSWIDNIGWQLTLYQEDCKSDGKLFINNDEPRLSICWLQENGR